MDADVKAHLDWVLDAVFAHNELGLDTVELIPPLKPAEAKAIEGSHGLFVLDHAAPVPRRALVFTNLARSECDLDAIGAAASSRPLFDLSLLTFTVALDGVAAIARSAPVGCNSIDTLRDYVAALLNADVLIQDLAASEDKRSLHIALICRTATRPVADGVETDVVASP